MTIFFSSLVNWFSSSKSLLPEKGSNQNELMKEAKEKQDCLPPAHCRTPDAKSRAREELIITVANKVSTLLLLDQVNDPKRRLQKEMVIADWDPSTHCSFGMAGDDIFKLQGTIVGPDYTPYKNGLFFLSIDVPNGGHAYPFVPPKIKFQTKVFHPNVGEDGTIYVDILARNWSPALTVEKLLLSICSLLADPDPVDPHNPIYKLYSTDRKSYNQIAREWTKKYAMSY